MTKLLGSALVLTGGLLVWLLAMAERRRQRDTLWDLITALHRMGEEVRMARTPLPQLLCRMAEECGTAAAAFFRCGGESLGRGERWTPQLEVLPVSPRAARLLRDFARDLKGDEENICKVISLVMLELQKEWENLERGRQAAEKQLAAVCFSASSMLVILLI